MAQPPVYDRSYSFHDYQAENPLKPLPADKLDEEFARVKVTLDGILQNLKLIQRDDTALANKSVGYDQLKDEIQIGFNSPTDWTANHNYVARDIVFLEASIYRCLVSHISSNNFEDDLNAGYWELVVDFTTVQTTAIAARDAALQAQADAEDARDDALQAQADAESARGAAIGAKNDALLAKSGAESARDAAVVAKGLAEVAQAGAEAAQHAAEDARDDAMDAKNVAQVAAAVAAGFASDIVSQGNVPIYASIDTASGVEIPAGINLVRLNGWAAADAPGANFKEVPSEPSHAGKFQSADGRWWEIIVPSEGLDVRLVGVKADGVTDDYAAIMRADSITNKLIFPAGRIRVSQKLIPTNHPIHWRGHDKAVNRTTYSKKATQIVGDHDDDGVIEIYASVNSRTEFFTIEGMEITGKLTSPPDGQHGLIIRSRWHWSSLQRVTFSELTGYGIAVVPKLTYAQNVRWEDISMYNCGGAVGYTSEPEAGDNDLACTQLKIINFNFDHQIKPQSPRPYLLDFRGMRGITADNMVLEGAGAVGLDAVFAFATNSYNRFENVHIEFTTNAPPIIAHFQHTNNKFYSSPEGYTVFSGIGGKGKFKFDAGVEHQCVLRQFGFYTAESLDDICEFADHTGSLTIQDWRGKRMMMVPPERAGQIKILSQLTQDGYMGWLSQGPTRLFRWRPSMGIPTTVKNRFVDVALNQVADSAIEADPDDARLLVWRTTGTDTGHNSTLWRVYLPDEWRIGGALPWVTAVMRYRVDRAPGDGDLLVRALGVGSGVAFVDTGMNTVAGEDGVWTTAVYSIRPNSSPVSIANGKVGTPTGPYIMRIAAFDLYLGLDWAEPLDLDAP